MNKKKNQLFRIIAALQPTEKAYFKKFGYKLEKEESVLNTLFDLIDKGLKSQAEFSEEKVIGRFEQKFPGQSYIRAKSRLLEQVLAAMRDYDRKHNHVEKLFDYLAIADSLRKRELFHDAWSTLQKAEKLATELEAVELLILIKTKMYYYETFTHKYEVKYAENETMAEIQEDLKILENRIDADLASYRILHFQKSIGVPRTESDFQLFREIRQHPAFGEDYETRLVSSRLNLAVALNGIFFSIGDTASVIRVSENLVENYEVGEKLGKINSFKFLSLYDTLLQAALLSLNVALFEKHYPAFQEVKTFGEDDKNLKIGIDLYARSIYAIVANRTELIPELTAEFEQVREREYIPNYRKISLGYYMSFGPFLRGDYDQAFSQIQWMKNHQHLGMRHDIEVGILAMECLILLEKGDLDLLEYRLRAFDESLKRQQRKMAMENAFLQLMRKCMSSPAPNQLHEIHERSLTTMREIIAAEPAEAAFLNAFDIVSWLESKLKEESFQEVYYRNNIPQAAGKV